MEIIRYINIIKIGGMYMQVKIKTEVITETLIKTNKNQKWLADKIGVSSGYISDIISGNVVPAGKVRDNLMKALGIKEWDGLYELVESDIAESSQPMPL
jgi:ribosome-binding protein aMBF1 (putative translation factor)